MFFSGPLSNMLVLLDRTGMEAEVWRKRKKKKPKIKTGASHEPTGIRRYSCIYLGLKRTSRLDTVARVPVYFSVSWVPACAGLGRSVTGVVAAPALCSFLR